jgi:hypothetical protein
MTTVEYTTNKIYFIVSNGEDFLKKHKDFLINNEMVYDVKTFNFAEKDFINITLDFKNGRLTQKQFNTFMNTFIIDNNVKKLNKAWYKFKDKYDEEEVKLNYTLCI